MRYPGKDISGMCESQGSKMFLLPYVKTWGSGTRQPGLESSLYHLLAAWQIMVISEPRFSPLQKGVPTETTV